MLPREVFVGKARLKNEIKIKNRISKKESLTYMNSMTEH